jgi:hypothetical protein
MKWGQTTFSLLAASIIAMGNGCAPMLLAGGAIAGAAVATFIKGELVTHESYMLDQTWLATQKAMKSLGFTIQKEDKDSLTALIVAHGAEDKKVEIHLKKEAIHVTQIRIRVGLFGDEELSRHILREIQKELKPFA